MGIFGALTTAVTGLRAQSFALENISGNIANSQTTAFKRIDTSFIDLIPDNPPSKQLSGTVIANARATNTVQGDFQIGLDRHLHGDQRRRVFRRAEAGRLCRRPADLRRQQPLHAPRRLPDRQGRLPGERRRLLSDGHSGRLQDRQPRRQRAGDAQVPERLPPRAADDADPVSRQPRELSADTAPRRQRSGVRTDRPEDLLGQSCRRRPGAREDHRLRRDAAQRCKCHHHRHADAAGHADRAWHLHGQWRHRDRHRRHDPGAAADRDQHRECRRLAGRHAGCRHHRRTPRAGERRRRHTNRDQQLEPADACRARDLDRHESTRPI